MATSKIDIYIENKLYKYKGPSDWNSLSRIDFLTWCSMIGKMMSVEEALASAGYLFFKIPAKVYKRLGSGEDLAIADKMRWLMDNRLTNNVIGKFRIGWRVYFGPANRLANLSIGEYRRTELLYQLYNKSGKRDYLLALAATLFRTKGGTMADDMRCILTEAGVSSRAKFFKWALHPTILKGILLFYEGCRADIVRRFPIVFTSESNSESNPLAKPVPAISDLEDIILAYSGGKLGNFDETMETNIYVFFKHLQQKIEEYNHNK